MKVIKKTTWVVPSGIHQAIIADARITNGKNGTDELRLIFEITSLIHPLKKYQAKKTYNELDQNHLAHDLEALLKDDIGAVIGLEGEILADKLGVLEGKCVEIEVTHLYDPAFKDPFCKVRRIGRPGQLLKKLVP